MSKRARTVKIKPAPAVTAQRAAEIFGAPDSLFTGRARVSAKALQRGLSEMISRVYSTVPNVAPLTGSVSGKRRIALTYIGEQAQCRYDWDAVAPSKFAASAVINLPVIGDDGNMIPRSIADQYTAYALHELGHVLFTPLHAFRRAIADLATRHRVSQDFAKSIVNALEDVDLERNIIAHGYAPGAATMLGALLQRCVARIPQDAHGTLEAFSVTLAFGLRGYAPNAQALVDALPPALRRIYDAAGADLRALPLRSVGDGGAMDGVTAVADKVIAALCALRDAEPPQPEPGDGQGDGAEPGDGQGDGAEPGDGQGDGAEPGDGQGDGAEPGDGQGDGAEPGDGQGDGAEPGDGQGDGAEPGDGQGDGAEPGDGQGDGAEPGDGQGDGDVPSDLKQVLGGMIAALSSDMSPEAAGDIADGASGLTNDNVRVRNAYDAGQTGADAMQSIAVRTLGKAPKVAQALRQLLDASAYDSKEGGRRSGSLRTGALHRVATGADTVFERRSYRDGSDNAVTLLIDQSSSMNGDSRHAMDNETAPVHHARNLAAALARLLSQSAGTSFECLGFTTGGGQGGNEMVKAILENFGSEDDKYQAKALWGSCIINVFKTFKDAPAIAMRRLQPCSGSGGTPDAAAITAACDRLLQQPAARRVFIMLADGEGSAKEVLAKILQRYTAHGIIAIGIGIGQDMNAAFQYRARVDDSAQLGSSGLATLLAAVAKDHVYQGGGDD